MARRRGRGGGRGGREGKNAPMPTGLVKTIYIFYFFLGAHFYGLRAHFWLLLYTAHFRMARRGGNAEAAAFSGLISGAVLRAAIAPAPLPAQVSRHHSHGETRPRQKMSRRYLSAF